jgi:CRP/FNR family cyclic AMP-dependent transcriptional regulator
MRWGAHPAMLGDVMNAVELLGYAAVAVNIGVYLMRTMIPLRIFAVATNCLFIAWAFLDDVYPTLVLNLILLPLNGYRLAEMLLLVRRTRTAATKHDFDINVVRSFARTQNVANGDKLFAMGDIADAMYVIESGRFVLPESGIALAPGAFVGELGLLSPGGLRTQSLVCTESGSVQRLSYDQFRQLFFQNPKFGYYFLQLTTERLFENVTKLEQTLNAHGISNPLTGSRLVAAK